MGWYPVFPRYRTSSGHLIRTACSILLAITTALSYFRLCVFQAPYISALLSPGKLGLGTSRLPGVALRDSILFRGGRIEPRGPWFPWFDSVVTLDGWNMIVIPLWAPLACVSLLTVVLFIRNRARPLKGCCVACSYNLTGNVSGVCPECGTKIETGGGEGG